MHFVGPVGDILPVQPKRTRWHQMATDEYLKTVTYTLAIINPQNFERHQKTIFPHHKPCLKNI